MDFEINTLLSGILKFGPEGLAECCDIVNENSFDDVKHSVIFSSFEKLMEDNKEFRITEILSECSRVGLQPKDFQSIKDILGHDCESLNVIRSFAKKIYCNKALTESITSHQKCIEKLTSSKFTEIDQIFSISEDSIFDLVNKYSDTDSGKTFGQQAEEIIQSFKENPTESIGLPLPWPKVNEAIGNGLRPGVTLFGARSKVGKSSIAMMTSAFLSRQKIPVLILDTEMLIDDVVPRIMSNLSQVEINEIESGKYAENSLYDNAMVEALKELNENDAITHKYVGGKPFPEILSIARRWIYTNVGINEKGHANQCLIIYDYFKLMDVSELDNVNESQAMGFQISKLTDFLKKYKIPCLSFVQLNRTGIEKETTEIIFGSDKLLHICNNLSIIKHKTVAEMREDGIMNGNRKFISLASRYGGEREFGEYISMQANLAMCTMLEVGLVKSKAFSQDNKDEEEVDI